MEIERRLKPCPFCGGAAIAVVGGGQKAIVRCMQGCDAAASEEIKTDNYYQLTLGNLNAAFDKAIEKWNTRYYEPDA